MDDRYYDTSLYPVIPDHDTSFSKLAIPPFIINQYDPRIEEDRKLIRELTGCYYNTDQISVTPRCRCGETKGGFAMDLNRVCPTCGGKPEKLTEARIEASAWMTAPPGVKGLIEPNVWTVFFSKFCYNKGRFNPFEWLASPIYIGKQEGLLNSTAMIADLQAMGLKRGLNSLIDNCDMLVNYLLQDSMIKKLTTGNSEFLMPFYQKYKHLFFPKHLPIPNRLLFIVEDNATGRYADHDQKAAKDAIHTITTQNSLPPSQLTAKQLRHNENVAYRASRYMQEFYIAYEKEKMWPKAGIIRQNGVASRTPFSGRSVIASLTKPHRHTDIVLPWSIVIPMLKPHFLNRLYRRGYGPMDALNLINAHINKYHPVLDEIIGEFEKIGIAISIGRNPTLQWLSIRECICHHVGRDPDQKAILLSILTVGPYNADFDGDEMSIMFYPDMISRMYLKGLSSHQCVMDMNKPFTLSGNVKLPTIAIANLNRWKTSND